MLSDSGKPCPRKRDIHPHCSTIQIEQTQGDSEGKINFWGMKVSIIVIKNSLYEYVCYSEWVPRKREGCLNLQIQQHCEW